MSVELNHTIICTCVHVMWQETIDRISSAVIMIIMLTMYVWTGSGISVCAPQKQFSKHIIVPGTAPRLGDYLVWRPHIGLVKDRWEIDMIHLWYLLRRRL